jgi:predicted DNA-binding transcriptional regulator AlpA
MIGNDAGAALTRHYLSRLEVKQRTGLSDVQIDALMPDGYFPEPVRIWGKSIGWLDHEIADWLRGRTNSTPGGAR